MTPGGRSNNALVPPSGLRVITRPVAAWPNAVSWRTSSVVSNGRSAGNTRTASAPNFTACWLASVSAAFRSWPVSCTTWTPALRAYANAFRSRRPGHRRGRWTPVPYPTRGPTSPDLAPHAPVRRQYAGQTTLAFVKGLDRHQQPKFH